MAPNIKSPNTYPDTNELERSTKPSLDIIAQNLLDDFAINKLPFEDQGRVIADRFVGSLVRHGAIESSLGTQNPGDVLHFIDGLSSINPNVAKPDFDTITPADGLREGVKALAADSRVGKLIGGLSHTLETDGNFGPDEKFTLTSAAQIEGYLTNGGDANFIKDGTGGVHMPGEDWIPVIAEQIELMTKNPNATWMNDAQIRSLAASDAAPLVQQSSRNIQMARASAEKADIDLDLLKRSAEKLQERVKVDHDLGKTALFVAMNNRIRLYERSIGL